MRTSNQLEKYVVMIPSITKTASTPVTGNTVTGFGGNTNGGIDTLGFRRLVAVTTAGAMAASSGLNVKLQESSDESTYTDITSASIVALTATSDNSCPAIELGLDGRARYIRAIGTPTTDDSVAFGVLGILKDPTSAPVTQLTTAVSVNS